MVYGYIYKISFPNGKDYIGLTNRTIEQRWYEHNKCAKSGDTRCLYNALRKYNMVDTFQMIVIDTAETNEELCEKEIAHIEINNSHYKRGYGYNMTDGGDTTVGYEYTEKDREKMSKSQKKRFEDPEERRKCGKSQKKVLDSKGKNKPFDVFEKNGTYIKSFNYQFEAMEYLQTTYDIKTIIRIGEVLRGTRKSSHGFTFKYKE